MAGGISRLGAGWAVAGWAATSCGPEWRRIMDDMNRTDLIELTAEIISAYVSNNTVVASDLPAIIGDVHDALSKASQRVGQIEREELRPAVTVKKSVTPDYIVCLEDGKKFKSLK